MLYKLGQVIRGFMSGGRGHGDGSHGTTTTTTSSHGSSGLMGKLRGLLRR